jgi:hypothetical protein
MIPQFKLESLYLLYNEAYSYSIKPKARIKNLQLKHIILQL